MSVVVFQRPAEFLAYHRETFHDPPESGNAHGAGKARALYFGAGRCDTFGVFTGVTLMSTRTRARDCDELIEFINQALDEVEDLRAAIEYDEEYRGESSIIVEPTSNGLSRLLSAIDNDEYRVGEGDWLDFLDSLRESDHRAMPFWPLLRVIIETHENGYQAED
jgi:hypothetical protein